MEELRKEVVFGQEENTKREVVEVFEGIDRPKFPVGAAAKEEKKEEEEEELSEEAEEGAEGWRGVSQAAHRTVPGSFNTRQSEHRHSEESWWSLSAIFPRWTFPATVEKVL